MARGRSREWRGWLALAPLVLALLSGAGCAVRAGRSSAGRAAPRREAPLSPRPSPGSAPATCLPEARRSPVVCIDPGHPSEAGRGATAPGGLTEIHAAWAVGLKLRALLQARGIATVVTKSRESEFITNRKRAETANAAHAALMIRLHCDSGPAARAGFAIYYPNRQGRAQGVAGPSREVMARSRAAAEALHAGMTAVLQGALADGGVRDDTRTRVGRRQGALTGSIFCRVPVALVEMAVLSRQPDAAFLASPAGQERMARALAEGIERFVRPR